MCRFFKDGALNTLFIYSKVSVIVPRENCYLAQASLSLKLNNKLCACELDKADQKDEIEARDAIKGIVLMKRKLVAISPPWSLSLRLNDLYMTVRCLSEVRRVFMCG